jgi:hypothetical protein
VSSGFLRWLLQHLLSNRKRSPVFVVLHDYYFIALLGRFRLNDNRDFDGVAFLIECRLPTLPLERSGMEYLAGASFVSLPNMLFGSEKARSYRVTATSLSAVLGCPMGSVFGESK